MERSSNQLEEIEAYLEANVRTCPWTNEFKEKLDEYEKLAGFQKFCDFCDEMTSKLQAETESQRAEVNFMRQMYANELLTHPKGSTK